MKFIRSALAGICLAVAIAAPAHAASGPNKFGVYTAPGATDHSLAPSMRGLQKANDRAERRGKSHKAHAAAQQWEWPGSPWGGTVPEHSLDCIDSSTRDDPALCASRTGARYAPSGVAPYYCNAAFTSLWWGTVALQGNFPAAQPAACPSNSYLHASVAEEVLGWYYSGNYSTSNSPLAGDCKARLGWTGGMRIIALQWTTRDSNQLVRPVVAAAVNGVIPGVQPYATACVYSTPGTSNFNGNGGDQLIGIPSGTPTYYGVFSWG